MFVLANLADMQLISKFNKGFRFLLCVIHIYSKYVWVVTSKYKKCITITYAIQNILDESVLKPKKIWVDKASQFYNRSMKSWLQDNIKKCIQHIMKENMLLLKNLLEL